MTAISTTQVTIRATPEQRRARVVGVILVVLAAFVFWAFGLNVMGDLNAIFLITLPTDRFANIGWEINTRTLAYIVALYCCRYPCVSWRYAAMALEREANEFSISYRVGLICFLVSGLGCGRKVI